MRKKSIFSILALTILSIIISTNITFAAVASYTELAPLPGTCTDTAAGCVVNFGPGENLGNYINGLYKLAVAAASVLAVVMIIIGGFSYVSSDAINNKEEGKSQIKSALGGLLLVLASWVILNTVNPQLTSLKLVSKALEERTMADLLGLSSNAIHEYQALEGQAIVDRINNARGSIETLEKTAGTVDEIIQAYNDDLITEDQMAGALSDLGITSLDDAQQFSLATKKKADILRTTASIMEFANLRENTLLSNSAVRRNTTELTANAMQVKNKYESILASVDTQMNEVMTPLEKTCYQYGMALRALAGVNKICALAEKISITSFFPGGTNTPDEVAAQRCLTDVNLVPPSAPSGCNGTFR